MQLPDPSQIYFREVLHGHGDNGMWFYIEEDRPHLGIVRRIAKEVTGEYSTKYWFKWLPDREFKNLDEMLPVLATLTDEAIAAEKAKWPVLVGMREREVPSGKCWNHTDRFSTHLATIRTCWLPHGGHQMAPLCAECASTGLAETVAAAVVARHAYVRSMRG